MQTLTPCSLIINLCLKIALKFYFAARLMINQNTDVGKIYFAGKNGHFQMFHMFFISKYLLHSGPILENKGMRRV